MSSSKTTINLSNKIPSSNIFKTPSLNLKIKYPIPKSINNNNKIGKLKNLRNEKNIHEKELEQLYKELKELCKSVKNKKENENLSNKKVELNIIFEYLLIHFTSASVLRISLFF